MTQNQYFTPRQIFQRLKMFEQMRTLENYEEYTPLFVVQELSEENLCKEVNRMLLFVGLLCYKSQCRWVTLPEDKGGEFTVSPDRTICINVSDRLKGNQAAVLATLAHEVCHAIMFHWKIAQGKGNETENEYCTDLCTIYVGFGRLIINGYNTCHDGVYNQLGYFSYDIYKQTYNLINIARSTRVPLLECQDNMYLSKTLKVWAASTNKERLLERQFIDKSKEITRIINARNCLVEAVKRVLNRPVNQYHLKHLTDNYDSYVSLSNSTHRYPIHSLSVLYETTLIEDTDDDVVAMKNVCSVLEKTIVDISHLAVDVDFQSITVPVECPHCGEKRHENRDYKSIIRCSKCQRPIYTGAQGYRVSDVCRSVSSVRIEEEQRLKEEFERGRKQGLKQGVESNAATSYQRGYSTAKEELRKRNEALPFWLRWLISKYLLY